MNPEDERYCFVVEWYDPFAFLTRKYNLLFFPKDNSVEMIDKKFEKIFLKRIVYEDLCLKDLYIGSIFHVFSRKLTCIDFGDEFTRRKCGSEKEKTFGFIKPDAIPKIGEIIDLIYRKNFIITKLKMCTLTQAEVENFYKEHQSKYFFYDLINFMTCGPLLVFELVAPNAVQSWKDFVGNPDPDIASEELASSLRAKYGKNKTFNACHASDSAVSAAREVEFFFPTTGKVPKNTARLQDCTCGIIKPHIVLAGKAGKIIDAILDAGFEISAMQMFNLDKATVEELYEIYKGIVPEYGSMVNELTSGPCITMEIRAVDAPQKFRDVCGPVDPEIGRCIRPRTLRSVFGINKIKNAIHCTDLPEDALLEVEYFFKILDQ